MNPLHWSEPRWMLAAAGFGMILAGWLAWRNREHLMDTWDRLMGREQPGALAVEPTGALVAPEDDNYLPARWAAQDHGLTSPSAPMTQPVPALRYLPDEDTRTMLLSQLAEPCKHCGGDHPGSCAEEPAPFDYFYRPARNLPGPEAAAEGPYHRGGRAGEPDEYITGRVVEVMQAADGWHWVLGTWQPPVSAWERLPHEDWLEPGKPDWLRELLVTA